ncbi:exodeoxyribonuclease VII large subunit [Neisseriaceae bacterium ESL0693]|nr:exodeoxyribonuclease VII large subunit [Neisseriaceae bacterium ESL0693]
MSDLFTTDALSVSELNARARTLLEGHLAGLWITGEVSNLTRAASGHYYFSLKDSHAQVRCVLFKGIAASLSLPLKEGDHIDVSGKISIYEARGEFQITIMAVRSKGLGKLYEAYERLKQQLLQEGLFAPERKRPLPPHPHTIGVVTSLAAAALRDVVSTLRRRHSGLKVIVYPTAVQGSGSEKHIAAAIETANQRKETDLLIVCRGGGSIEDLWSYNEEIVVRAIANSQLPIVSGVGHETDFTLADFVADVRAPTPTAAAELVSPDLTQLRQHIRQYQYTLQQLLQQRYYDAAQKLDWIAHQLRHPRQNWLQQQTELTSLQQRLNTGMQRTLTHQQRIIDQQQQQLLFLKPQTARLDQQLKHWAQQLHQAWKTEFDHKKQLLQQQKSLLTAISPEQILARGYSVVTNKQGHVITDAGKLRPGQQLHIRFARGERQVQVLTPTPQADLFD